MSLQINRQRAEVDAALLTFLTETNVCVCLFLASVGEWFVCMRVKPRIIGTQLLEMCIFSLLAGLF